MNKLPFEDIKRDILVKQEAISGLGYAEGTQNDNLISGLGYEKGIHKDNLNQKKTKLKEELTAEQLINYGIVNINKPRGPTSHQVSDYVKKILNINKAGHSGTLDPNVTGVLPVALGRATKIVQVLMPAGKEYVVIMHIHKNIDKDKLTKTIMSFVGRIKQKPPLKSAVKRVLRERTIYYIEILEIDDKDVLFRVGCEAGTYIRKLCDDIGKKLGGAHMAELIRTKAGPFDNKETYTLQELADAYYYYKQGNDKYIKKIIKPIETAITHLPKVWVLDTAINTLVHGVDLKTPGISKVNEGININDTVAVVSLNDKLIAIGKAIMESNDMATKEKGVAVKVEKVFA